MYRKAVMRLFPSLEKEGWREAPGWFVRCGQPPRRLRRHPSSERRGISFPPHPLRRELHRLDDRLVARAAAQVAADRVADLLLARVGVGLEQRLRGDQHAARAVA